MTSSSKLISKDTLFQTDLDQTGYVIFTNGERIPLFNSNATDEGIKIATKLGLEIENIFITSNILDVSLTDLVEEYMVYNKNLPEDLAEDVISGFPPVSGTNKYGEVCITPFFC